MSKKLYKDFDRVYSEISQFLSNYSKSKILQNYFHTLFKSFFYGNVINNFFLNLNQKNIKEYNLPKGKIGKIKIRYKKIQKEIKLAVSLSLKDKKIDEIYYNNFKLKIKKDFPEFLKIVSKIEKEINIEKARNYLKKKEEEIKKLGKPDEDLNTFYLTKLMVK